MLNGHQMDLFVALVEALGANLEDLTAETQDDDSVEVRLRINLGHVGRLPFEDMPEAVMDQIRAYRGVMGDDYRGQVRHDYRLVKGVMR